MHTCKYACTHTLATIPETLRLIHTYKGTHTHTHTHTHTRMHARMHTACMHVHTHTHTRTHAHCMHACAHTHTHTHTHTYTHTHTPTTTTLSQWHQHNHGTDALTSTVLLSFAFSFTVSVGQHLIRCLWVMHQLEGCSDQAMKYHPLASTKSEQKVHFYGKQLITWDAHSQETPLPSVKLKRSVWCMTDYCSQ